MAIIDVINLQNQLIDNPDKLIAILIHLSFDKEKIRYNERQHLITSPRPGGDNDHGCLLYTNSLRYIMTTRSDEGNIFSLVMKMKECNFPRALELISEWTEINVAPINIVYPFGAFYKNIAKDYDSVPLLNEYSEDSLPDKDKLSIKFLKDNIALCIQEKYGIRYDSEENSILIPIYDCNNRLIGCKGRNNDSHCLDSKRWYAYLPYSKTSVVYGWNFNYQEIVKKKMVFIFESEKSVLQCASFNCNIAVAIGGHMISNTQINIIKSLMAEKIVVAFDESLSKEEIEYEAKKLVLNNSLYHNKVGYIYDENNEILPKGSKCSPSDLGRNNFIKLVKEHITWV